MGKKATVRQLQCAMLLCAEGYMPSGASALTGNFSQESGINLPTAFRTHNLDHGSNGLAQWRLKRLTEYEDYVQSVVGDVPNDELWEHYGRLDLQCKFVAIEMRAHYPALDAKLRKGGSVSALTSEVCWSYEIPSRSAANLANRIAQALVVFNSIPQGAPAARQTSIVAMMDEHADAHDAQKRAGVASVIGGSVLGGLTVVGHAWSLLHWWEWAILGVVLFMVVTGLTAATTNAASAALIRNAKPKVDPDAPKATGPAPAMPSAAPLTVAEPEQPKRPSAKELQDAAIEAALKTQGSAAQEDVAHAEVEQHVAGTRQSAMSIGKAQQEVKP